MDTPLRTARLRAQKTLTEVAAANGLAKGSLSRIETTKRKATAALAERLAKYFGTVSEIEILYPERYVGGTASLAIKGEKERRSKNQRSGAAA